jgi:serine phosphatase RsbU (regulator of sigma subunit)
VASLEGLTFREHSFELSPGDTLFVYTDGVTEATNANNELFGTDRLDAIKAKVKRQGYTYENVGRGKDYFMRIQARP